MSVENKFNMNAKVDKESIGFLFDNGLLSKKYSKVDDDLIQELTSISEFLYSNLVETKTAKGETYFVYDSYIFAVIEHHLQNAIIFF